MSQFVTPTIPPAQDLDSLRIAISSAISKVTEQLNQQAADPSVDGAGLRIQNVATPTSWNDAVNKRYLEDRLSDLQQFPPNPRVSLGSANPYAVEREGYAVVTFDALPSNKKEEVTWVVFAIDETDVAWSGSAGTLGASGTSLTYAQNGTSRYGERIRTLTISNAGTSYGGNQPIIFSGGGGTAAAGTAIIHNGTITNVSLTDPGFGYATAPSGTITTGGGHGASITAALGGFLPGDFVIWNDPLSYEINQIKTVISTAITFVHGTNTATRSAFFGSVLSTHAAGIQFYRLNAHSFITDLNGVPAQKAEFISANKCLVAAASPYKNYTISVNLNHGADSNPAPGLRMMNGAEYVLGAGTATLTTGMTSDIRVPVAAWEGLRNVYAWVQDSPAGTASAGTSVQVSVIYIDPTLATAGLIGTCSIGTGSHLSWSTRPDGLNMPPQGTWPPSILPVLTNALDTNGNLTGTGTVGAKSVVFQPDGFIDFIISQVGATTAGGRLGVTVQS